MLPLLLLAAVHSTTVPHHATTHSESVFNATALLNDTTALLNDTTEVQNTTALPNTTAFPASNKSDDLRPIIADMVAITIVSNWSHVCRNLKTYVMDLCHTIMQTPSEECVCNAISLSGIPLVRGICISLGEGRRRNLYEFTTLEALILHKVPFTNETKWPTWAASVRTGSDVDRVPYYFYLGCFTLGILAFFLMLSATKLYKRYMGYKKLPPTKGVEPATS